MNLDTNVIVESGDVEFIENKFINDSTNELEPVVRSSSDIGPSSKRKESEISFEPRRSQCERKEKSFGLDFISFQALSFLVEGDGNKVLIKYLLCST